MSIISIEGTPGVGKTTLLKKLQETFSQEIAADEIVFIEEPLQRWLTVKDETDKLLFDKMREDSERWNYIFQLEVLSSRIDQIIEARSKNPKVIITDRGVETGIEVFGKQTKGGRIPPDIFKSLIRLGQAAFEAFDTTPLFRIYLTTTLDTVKDRISKRNLHGDADFDSEYVRGLHNLHDDFLLFTDEDVVICDSSPALESPEYREMYNNITYRINKVLENPFSGPPRANPTIINVDAEPGSELNSVGNLLAGTFPFVKYLEYPLRYVEGISRVLGESVIDKAYGNLQRYGISFWMEVMAQQLKDIEDARENYKVIILSYPNMFENMKRITGKDITTIEKIVLGRLMKTLGNIIPNPQYRLKAPSTPELPPCTYNNYVKQFYPFQEEPEEFGMSVECLYATLYTVCHSVS